MINDGMAESPDGFFMSYQDYAELQKSMRLVHSLAEVMNHLLPFLEEEGKKLVAENAAMIKLLTDVSDNHTEFFNESEDGMYVCLPLDYISEINMYVSRDVNAENPFERTDAAIAEIKAPIFEEMGKLAGSMLNDAINVKGKEAKAFTICADRTARLAANLRAGRK